MKERPTPETDRVYNRDWRDGTPETLASLMINHAEKMEQQRDELLEVLESHAKYLAQMRNAAGVATYGPGTQEAKILSAIANVRGGGE